MGRSKAFKVGFWALVFILAFELGPKGFGNDRPLEVLLFALKLGFTDNTRRSIGSQEVLSNSKGNSNDNQLTNQYPKRSCFYKGLLPKECLPALF